MLRAFGLAQDSVSIAKHSAVKGGRKTEMVLELMPDFPLWVCPCMMACHHYLTIIPQTPAM